MIGGDHVIHKQCSKSPCFTRRNALCVAVLVGKCAFGSFKPTCTFSAGTRAIFRVRRISLIFDVTSELDLVLATTVYKRVYFERNRAGH
jgi:hypothetical protein